MQPYKSLAAVIGLSLCGISLYIIHKYWKKDEDDLDEDLILKTSNRINDEIVVPKNLVREIIGREGCNIKQIAGISGARIYFRDSKDQKLCCLSGSIQAVHIAKQLIKEFIESQPIIEDDNVTFPREFTGKIIGRCGKNLTELRNRSGAKITITQEADDPEYSKVYMRGTKEQLLEARSLLSEKIKECSGSSYEIDSVLAKRKPRAAPKSVSNSESMDNLSDRIPKNETLSPVQGPPVLPFEVYVSAITDPSKFWIQLVGPKATELDQLVDEMTDFYSDACNRELFVLNSIQKGNLVAAIFKYDNKWYRAEVLSIDEVKKEAELYYVDYGDTDVVSFQNILELRTDFLSLHFQAIECFLDNVEPVDGQWRVEAVDLFEDLTYVAQWKKLMAKIKRYSNKEKTGAAGHEDSPVPGISLYDYADKKYVNIAEELVSHGFATYKTQPSARSSRASSVSSVSS